MGRWLIAIVLLAGCAPSGEAVDEGGNVRRFHDPQMNVTCWYVPGGYQGGIDCIPDHELRRDQ